MTAGSAIVGIRAQAGGDTAAIDRAIVTTACGRLTCTGSAGKG